MARKILGIACGFALGLFAIAPAHAAPMVVGQSVLSGGMTFTLTACSYNPNAGPVTNTAAVNVCSSNAEFVALSGGVPGIVLRSVTTGQPLESASGVGVVADTLLQFTVSSPVQNINVMTVQAMGCPGSPGCPAANVFTDAGIGGDIFDASHNSLTSGGYSADTLGPTGFETNSFAAQNFVEIGGDMKADAQGGYASFDSVVFTMAYVPEPMSAALLGFALLGLAASRRRRA